MKLNESDAEIQKMEIGIEKSNLSPLLNVKASIDEYTQKMKILVSSKVRFNYHL